MMRLLSLFVLLCATLACFQESFYDKVNRLKSERKFVDAKREYEAYLEKKEDLEIRRQYIQFLFDQKYYIDFNAAAQAYMREYPDDADTSAIKNLMFKYYAKLADDSERLGDYDQALVYIVNNLLSTDFEDYKSWELRQSAVLRKWYDKEQKADNLPGQKQVMTKMLGLGLSNLAKSVDTELYNELAQEPGETEPAEEEVVEPSDPQAPQE